MLTNEKCAEHLSGMVKIPTISNAELAKMDFSKFDELHALLREYYPLVHKYLKLEIIGRAALLYTWKGTGESQELPLVLTAHQDVVPEGDHALWKYPPFSGEIADGKVWGRGTTDCKCNIMSILEAVEHLLSEGFTPGYDIYICFGYNEETMGGESPAAQLLAQTLQNRGVTPGCVLDECGGVYHDTADGKDEWTASIVTAEKGYSDFELYVEDKGGHSSVPPKDSAMKKLAQAVIAVEENPFPYRITSSVKAAVEAEAAGKTDERSILLQNIEKNWDALLPIIESEPYLSAMFHTTNAVTMAFGSEQANILPQRCSVVVNCRALEGDTLEKIQKHFESIVPEGVKVRYLKGANAPKASALYSHGYNLITSICKETYPGIKVMPGYMLGGTDSRYYSEICDNVYRFCSIVSDDRWGPAHAANECIPIDTLVTGPEFFVKFITRY